MTRRAIVPTELEEAARETGFSPGVRAGDFIFLTGATGSGPDGVMPADVTTQARNAFAKALQVLAADHTGAEQVVELTSYHIDIDRHFAAVQTVLEEVFTAPLPAWTAVEVAKLRRPGALVEFRIIAHAPVGCAP